MVGGVAETGESVRAGASGGDQDPDQRGGGAAVDPDQGQAGQDQRPDSGGARLSGD